MAHVVQACYASKYIHISLGCCCVFIVGMIYLILFAKAFFSSRAENSFTSRGTLKLFFSGVVGGFKVENFS